MDNTSGLSLLPGTQHVLEIAGATFVRTDQVEGGDQLRGNDFSTLNAVAMCPRWGIVTNVFHKRMTSRGRAMALEAGKACHDVFAASRLWSIYTRGERLRDIFDHHGVRLFGEDRFTEMVNSVKFDRDIRTQHHQFALAALETSGYYDDPDDKRRTYTNVEEACIAYLDRIDYMRRPVWIEDEYAVGGATRVGIELPIDIIINHRTKPRRYIGRCDGLHTFDAGVGVLPLELQENKTASRLDNSWEMSFETSHQVTGYCVGTAVMLGLPDMIREACIVGLSIPIPRTYDYGGFSRPSVTRGELEVEEWLQWIEHHMAIIERYEREPWNATMNTNACNRYFRSCSMVPFCKSDRDERRDCFENEMTEEPWSPLDEMKEN